MKIKETFKITGKVKLLVNGKIVAESENLVTNVGKALVGDMLIDTSGYDTGITYCAVGTGTGTPAVTDTLLGTETYRKALTYKERAGNVMYLQTYFTASTVNVYIKEVGLFGHSTATATLNTGIMFARALLSFDNSGGSPVDLIIQWEVTLG